jgi:hypothetical protein
MVKICQTGLLKLNFETRPKKTHFPVFAKNFRRPWMKLKIFFANFQILGPLGCQGWVVIPQNVKKCQNHCTLPPIPPPPHSPEPVFVNLLRSPGIDSQPGAPVRNPTCRTSPPGYIGSRIRLLGIDSWAA